MARPTILREVQVLYRGERENRLEVARSANVVEAAFQRALPRVPTGGVAKVVVGLWRSVPENELEIRPNAPDGRDGDDVDEVNVAFDIDTFLSMSRTDRRSMLADVLTDSLVELSSVRGWPNEVFRDLQVKFREVDIAYDWDGPAKTSPDRKKRAEVNGFIDEDGAFVTLSVFDVGNGKTVATTGPLKLKDAHPTEFKVRAAVLKWSNNSGVTLLARPLRGLDTPEYPPLNLTLSG